MTETIQAELRSNFGKGAARRLRREGKIPAVIYGQSTAPIHIEVPGHDTRMALKHGGANAVLELVIDGANHLGLAKDVQVDPIRREIEHIDFIVVKAGERVTVEIPVITVGEAAADALVVTELSTVTVEADATNIPETVEVSVEGVEAGTQITAADIEVPSGAEVLTDDEALVVNVVAAPTAAEVEAELAEAEAEAGIERDEPEAPAEENAAE